MNIRNDDSYESRLNNFLFWTILYASYSLYSIIDYRTKFEFKLIELVKCNWTNWRQLICNFLIDTWYIILHNGLTNSERPNSQLKLFDFDSPLHSSGSILLTEPTRMYYGCMCVVCERLLEMRVYGHEHIMENDLQKVTRKVAL